ncbi:hypothetical protein CRYUN_Cryun05aG0196500 [Craigia yunnanensis]
MAWDLSFWVLCFFINISLVTSSFYQLLSLSDLEADHLNPFEASTRINAVVLPEFLLQGFLCVIFLLTWHWFMFLLTVPLTAYHLMLYLNRKHLVDVTEIFRDLNIEKKYRFVKLGIYLLLFTVVLFRLVISAFNSLHDEVAVHVASDSAESVYQCASCNFDLDICRALLQQPIAFPRPEHRYHERPLSFIEKHNKEVYGLIAVYARKKRQLQRYTAGNFHKLEHLHEHPLIFNEINDKEVTGYCSGCCEVLYGPIYKCLECISFDLHKACAELSLEINHYPHRQQPLTLSPNPMTNP